jgi:hypothetical protein
MVMDSPKLMYVNFDGSDILSRKFWQEQRFEQKILIGTNNFYP